MNRLPSVVAVLLLAGPAGAGDKDAAKASPADRLAAIRKEAKEAEAAYQKATEDLPDTPKGKEKAQKLYQEYDRKKAELFRAAVRLARAAPRSDAGFAALEWVLTTPRSYYVPGGKEALELATRYHARNPKVGKIVAWVGYFLPHEEADTHAAALALVRAVAEQNPDRTARGQAVMGLAWQAKRKFAAAEYKRSADVDRRAAEAEKAFEAVLKDYAGCPRLIKEDAPTLGEVARRELYELRHLRIGKTAPDIKGEDLDGLKFKLSDYRGKVVVLDFWGDW